MVEPVDASGEYLDQNVSGFGRRRRDIFVLEHPEIPKFMDYSCFHLIYLLFKDRQAKNEA